MTTEDAMHNIEETAKFLNSVGMKGAAYVLVKSGNVLNAFENLWVKTVDRLPTKADAGFNEQVMVCYRDEWDCFHRLMKWSEVIARPNLYWHSLPFPPLPDHTADAGKKVASNVEDRQ